MVDDAAPAAPDTFIPQERLRAYAEGRTTWSTLGAQGFENHLDVLIGLGRLGRRPPIAGQGGPNAQSRARGRAVLRQALQSEPPDGAGRGHHGHRRSNEGDPRDDARQ